jgi:hypothetical protein
MVRLTKFRPVILPVVNKSPYFTKHEMPSSLFSKLGQLKSHSIALIHTFRPSYLQIHFNVTCTPTVCLKSGFLPPRFLNTILINFSKPPSHEFFTLLNFITLIIYGKVNESHYRHGQDLTVPGG